MKNFLLFGYNEYYPWGGMRDFIKDFDSIEEAKEFMNTFTTPNKQDNYHIYSISERHIVWDNYSTE